jgi:hypothetical protein
VRTGTETTNTERNERCRHLSDNAYAEVKKMVANPQNSCHKIEVVNFKTCNDFGKYGEQDIRIDRRSKWGNPFVMRNESDRDKVCDKYKVYLDEKLERGDLDLDELKDARRLFCHCAPKRCHGHYLRELIIKKFY